jgi:hypothetical protein
MPTKITWFFTKCRMAFAFRSLRKGFRPALAKRAWSTLRVVFREGLFTVYLNGERLFEVEDQSFTRAGKTGLWTKADSVTYFDNFGVTPK